MHKKMLFFDNRDAISAVIAVMLMVAIAAAMAAVSYAYFTGLIGGKNLEEPPIIDFSTNENENTLTLTYIDRPVNWPDLEIRVTDGTNIEFISRTGEATVGQKINLNDEQTLTGTLTVTITHLPSDTMVGEYTFEDVT
jgi:FlaG/FlaF family flagellin (archaellin)